MKFASDLPQFSYVELTLFYYIVMSNSRYSKFELLKNKFSICFYFIETAIEAVF
ncbi:hypothetical protein LEP1GSC041_2470 [Leptospira noguchii str. 2006001870]|nr:hypothetical protein LEP1GSC041_2470 [Leptospira noguchii str. 2006001870]